MNGKQTAILVLGLGVLAGCGDSTLGPAEAGQTGQNRFSETITLDALQRSADSGPTRVEIKLIPGTLTAREVEVKEAEELRDREEIESTVTAIDGTAGTITLALGDLVVTFDGTTRFRAESGEDLGMVEFVNRIENALAADRQPAIEAKRAAPFEPQAPGDASFFASRLEIDDEADEPEIEINIDGDNFVLAEVPPPDAFLQVLGLEIEIRWSEGVTELEEEEDRNDAEVEFEGMVAAVDEGAGTVVLVDGTVLVILPETRIKREGDDDNLSSLAEVATALADGRLVEAEGEGVLDSSNPLTILVKDVEFETEDDVDDLPGEVDFEGHVVSIDEAAGTVTLESGTVVRVVAGTRIKEEGDDDNLPSLAAAVAAMAAGETVVADGKGVVESVQPRTIVASEIELEIDD